MKKIDIVNRLYVQADRYTDLAKELSLFLMINPDAANSAEVKRRAENHLIRAEAFKEAAHILSEKSSNRKS